MSESRCLSIRTEADIINARLLTRQMAKDAGLRIMDQARISLAVSSLAHIIHLGDPYAGQITLDRVARDGQSGVQVIWTVAADCDLKTILRDLDDSTLNTMVHSLNVQVSPDAGICITALMWNV